MRLLYLVLGLWMMFCTIESALAKQQSSQSIHVEASKAHHVKTKIKNKKLKNAELPKAKPRKHVKLHASKPKFIKRKPRPQLTKSTSTKLKVSKKKAFKTKHVRKISRSKKTSYAKAQFKRKHGKSNLSHTKSAYVPLARRKLAQRKLPNLHHTNLTQERLINHRLHLLDEKIAPESVKGIQVAVNLRENKNPALSSEYKTKLKSLGVNHPLLPIALKKVKQNADIKKQSVDLARAINYAIYSDGYNADVGVYVKSMKYNDALYTRNIQSPMTPASTLKILTAEAALIFLGPEYRFSTQLLTDAKSIKHGVLQGNLYIVLGGDPTLSYYDLEELFLALNNEQIYAVSGNVYIDNTAYDQEFYGPDWSVEDKGYCYAAPISASIINRNCIPFKISSSSSGRLAQVVTSSKYFYPAMRNSVITKAYGSHSCSVKLSVQSNSTLAIEGCIPTGQAWGISYVISDVLGYNRALFQTLLRHSNVRIYGYLSFGRAPETLSLISSHASKPLRLLINDMLKKSDNIIAGAIFKKLGQLYTHHSGSWKNGSYALREILAKHAGMGTTGLRALDGSGLSASNLTTPAQMMQVLNFAYHHYTSEDFVSALPIAGIDGTLKHRMGNIARKVRAKTGTISGVVSLAGFAESADKEPLAFVIMINGSKGLSWRYKTMEDKIALILTRYKRK